MGATRLKSFTLSTGPVVAIPTPGTTAALALLIDAVKKGDDSAVRSTYPDSVKSLAVCLAANEAMTTGQKVKVKA